MIVCPSCQHENLDGALFCDECGGPLTGQDMKVTQNIKTDQIRAAAMPGRKKAPAPVQESEAWASLHIVDSGQILPLTDRNEFMLGRISEAQPIMPDIDLTPYQAYANGVSRLHAVVKRENNRVLIMDLGSSNGTYLNGKRIPANLDLPLSHGDMVSLGKLKIQILLKNI